MDRVHVEEGWGWLAGVGRGIWVRIEVFSQYRVRKRIVFPLPHLMFLYSVIFYSHTHSHAI